MPTRHATRSLVLLATVGGALLSSTDGLAQGYYAPAYPPPPGYRVAPRYAAGGGYGFHRHDGFFMRLNVGPGYLTASETFAGATDTYSGFGLTLGAAFGGVIAPNLILYGEVFGTTVPDPDYSVSGTTGAAPLTGLDMTMVGFGPGIAYYLQPINVYLSGTLVFSRISFTETSTDYTLGSTDIGFGGSFMAGKEWWITADWGLGIAGQLFVGTMRDHPEYDRIVYDARMRAFAFSLLFSATYN